MACLEKGLSNQQAVEGILVSEKWQGCNLKRVIAENFKHGNAVSTQLRGQEIARRLGSVNLPLEYLWRSPRWQPY